MPIEIKVTKELGNFEPKFIGPFTARQSIIFGTCGAAAIGLYKIASTFLPGSMAWYACLPPAGIALLFNTPFYGMRFEQFLQSIFVNVFLAPTNRRYRSENTMEARITKMNKALDGHTDPDPESSDESKPELHHSPFHLKRATNKSKAEKVNTAPDQKGKGYKMSSKAIR